MNRSMGILGFDRSLEVIGLDFLQGLPHHRKFLTHESTQKIHASGAECVN